MRYVKAEEILPQELVEEIQKYIKGSYIYIPTNSKERKKWGEKSGAREMLLKRNQDIKCKYIDGATVHELADEYYLSINSIKKIVYCKKS